MEEKGGYLAELGVMTPSHILDALTDISGWAVERSYVQSTLTQMKYYGKFR